MLSVQDCAEGSQQQLGLQAACQILRTALSVQSCPHTQYAAVNIKFEQWEGKPRHLSCLHADGKLFAMSRSSSNTPLAACLSGYLFAGRASLWKIRSKFFFYFFLSSWRRICFYRLTVRAFTRCRLAGDTT